MHHAFRIGEHHYELELSRAPRGYRLHFDGATVPVDLTTIAGESVLSFDGALQPVVIATRGDSVFIHFDGAAYELSYTHPLDRFAQQSQGAASDLVRAPMPGNVISVTVQAGQAVKRGDTVLVMESMKMETTLTAPRDGVIDAVHFAAGQSFERDAVLLNLQTEPGA